MTLLRFPDGQNLDQPPPDHRRGRGASTSLLKLATTFWVMNLLFWFNLLDMAVGGHRDDDDDVLPGDP